MKLETITARIDRLLREREKVIVAIDGNCTAGKTTLAGLLSKQYDCNVFHMDDFFLRAEQRTPERLSQSGGNVDYERFMDEVLTPLGGNTGFSYRPFDCGSFQLAQSVAVTPKRLNIIEGTYSMHPYFHNPYDLRIFLTITPQLQRERILERPAFLHQRFFREWIPMEQQYFSTFRIPDQCDIVLDPMS